MSLISATFSTNPLTLPGHLAEANAELAGLDAEAIIAWALARATNPVVTTNFRPHSAALLHMVSRACPDIPVVWVTMCSRKARWWIPTRLALTSPITRR